MFRFSLFHIVWLMSWVAVCVAVYSECQGDAVTLKYGRDLMGGLTILQIPFFLKEEALTTLRTGFDVLFIHLPGSLYVSVGVVNLQLIYLAKTPHILTTSMFALALAMMICTVSVAVSRWFLNQSRRSVDRESESDFGATVQGEET